MNAFGYKINVVQIISVIMDRMRFKHICDKFKYY